MHVILSNTVYCLASKLQYSVIDSCTLASMDWPVITINCGIILCKSLPIYSMLETFLLFSLHYYVPKKRKVKEKIHLASMATFLHNTMSWVRRESNDIGSIHLILLDVNPKCLGDLLDLNDLSLGSLIPQLDVKQDQMSWSIGEIRK